MAQILKHRRGTTTALQTERGSEGEIFVDITKKTVVVMDGSTSGGIPLAKESDVPTKVSDLTNDSNFLTLGYYNQIKFSESYNDLTDLPSLFSGAYADLTGKPTIPTNVSQLANDAGYITSASVFSGSYNDLTDTPTLFSGSYNDLTETPDLTALDTSAQQNTTPTFSGLTISPNDELDEVNLGTVNLVNAGSVQAATIESNSFIGNNNVEFTAWPVSDDGYTVTLRGGQSLAGAGGSVFVDAGSGTTSSGDINIGTTNPGTIVVGRPGSTTEFYGSVNLGSATISGLGVVSELNNETSGDKLIITDTGSLVLTDASGIIGNPSGGGNNRGIIWDWGTANGGDDSVIGEYESSLFIGAGSSSNTSMPVIISTGAGFTNYWQFTGDGKLTFPDGSEQTTAYTVGAPTIVAMNVDGSTVYSENGGTTWSDPIQLSLNEVERVAVGKSCVVYTALDAVNDINDQLFYATTPGQEPTLVNIPLLSADGFFAWRDVHPGEEYVVAVGLYYDSANTQNEFSYPVFAYTIDGANWTVGDVDPGYQGAFQASEFKSVMYNGTGWLIGAGDNNDNAGAFFITTPDQTLDIGSYVPFDGLDTQPDVRRVKWTGTHWVIKDDNSSNIYFGDNANAIQASWTTVDFSSIFPIGNHLWEPGPWFEDAAGDGWYAVSSATGQVLATQDSGNTWVSSVPSAWHGTIESANTAEYSWIDGFTSNTDFTVWNGAINDDYIDVFTISNATPSDYNGDYYVRYFGNVGDLITDGVTNSNWVPGNYTGVTFGGGSAVNLTVANTSPRTISSLLITDPGTFRYFAGDTVVIDGSLLGGTSSVDDAILEVDYVTNPWLTMYDTYNANTGWANSTPSDWSGYGALTGADFTLDRGTYIDAFDYVGDKFLLGNDDEELYSSTDLQTWTKVNDLDDGFDYWNDISYNAAHGGANLVQSKIQAGSHAVYISPNGMTSIPGGIKLKTTVPPSYTDTAIDLDVTKVVQKLTAGASYNLPDGSEGQIMYFVLSGEAIGESVYISLNARMRGGFEQVDETNNAGWILFSEEEAVYYSTGDTTQGGPTTIYTAIFTDGYWNVQGGIRD